MRYRRLSPSWVTSFLLLLLLQGCGESFPSLDLLTSKPTTHGEVVQEPPLTTQFVNAYRSGDELAVEKAASPLYQQEWVRRGISLARRQAWLPSGQVRPDGTGGVFTLTFIDGLVGADDQAHLLYLARSGDQTNGSVWRIDADASGRVIWAEMVWLFSSDTPSLTKVSTPAEAGLKALPPPLAKFPPDMLIGIRDTSGWEGFYAARYVDKGRATVSFFGLDEEGGLRPGAWSYQGTKSATITQVELGSRGPGG
jgi:hypothetical protein